MPTPLELILDPVSIVVFALFGGLMLWEALAPARPLPRIEDEAQAATTHNVDQGDGRFVRFMAGFPMVARSRRD